MNRGFSTDQSTPSTLRRYLSLKSLLTREERINQSRLRFDLAVVVELMFGCYPRFCWSVAFSVLAGNMIIHLRW